MHIALLILLALAMGAVLSMVANKDTYRSFAEAKELPEGKRTTVVGELVNPDDIYYEPEIDPNLTTFYVKDKEGDVMQVAYYDAKPTDFERSEQVTIKGKIVGDQFVAEKLLVKCPSKYVDESVPEATAKSF